MKRKILRKYLETLDEGHAANQVQTQLGRKIKNKSINK